MKEIPETWTCRKKHGALTREGFYVFKHTPHADGSPSYRIKCRACDLEKSAARYLADPEAAKAEVRAKRAADPETWRAYNKKSYQKHRPARLSEDKVRREERRRTILSHYSDGAMCCATCGEGMYEFLCLDHLGGGGNAHRAELGRKSHFFYDWIVDQGFPAGYRALCHNCNNCLASRGKTVTPTTGPFVVPEPVRGDKGRQTAKLACLFHYGSGDPRCACCRVSNFELLTIDHVGGGGRKHRKELGNAACGSQFYFWLIRNGLPDGYRILCFNCNHSDGHGGCPHARVAEAETLPA